MKQKGVLSDKTIIFCNTINDSARCCKLFDPEAWKSYLYTVTRIVVLQQTVSLEYIIQVAGSNLKKG